MVFEQSWCAYALSLANTVLLGQQLHRALSRAAKRFCSVCGPIQERVRQREFDRMRELVTTGPQSPSRKGWQLEAGRLFGVDLQAVYSGFIKVDGVYRDAQYYISFHRNFTRPKRVSTPASSIAPPYKGFPVKTVQSFRALCEEEAPLTWQFALEFWDRPFTVWEE